MNKSLMEKFIFVERLKDCFSMKNAKLTRKKFSFPLRISSLNDTNLVTFTEEIFNGKPHFLWANGTAHTFALRF